MSLWSLIVEVFSPDTGYKSDYYTGEKGSGKHIHDWYNVTPNGVESGAVKTDEKTGEHTPTEKIR